MQVCLCACLLCDSLQRTTHFNFFPKVYIICSTNRANHMKISHLSSSEVQINVLKSDAYFIIQHHIFASGRSYNQ